MGRGLDRIIARRGWEEGLPKLGDAEITNLSDTRVRALYPTHDGELQATWSLRGDTWVLSGLRPPPAPDEDE